MENAFYIATCRFHVKEKDRLLITGYFLDNRPDGNRIEIRLDGSIAVVLWKRRIDEDLCSQ